MKYFTKYLPVPGEIKKGDLVAFDGKMDRIYKVGPKVSVLLDKDKKVKLFLCSRDIQVGDNVIRKDYTGIGIVTKVSGNNFWINHDEEIMANIHSKANWGKIIGEVSPAAIWVKEGMEFDNGDLEWGGGFLLFWNDQLSHWTKLAPFEQESADGEIHHPYIKLKCPTCNTFH